MSILEQLKGALQGRYELVRDIGEGGMATVYLARDVRHDRRVALKVLRPELGAVLGVERFLSEIRVTANLQHPNLLPLFDSGEVDGLLYYVMPFVEGESLRARLERERQLPVDEAIRLTGAIGAALDYAHRNGVVHRDLKPENILLHEGQPLVADFGIALAVSNAGGARVTQTGLSLGTPQYMSPEQATGDRQIDARSDIYSLGAMLYEMLVGEPPHTGATIQAIIARVLTEQPRDVRASRPTVPASIESAIRRALEKLPADRFATAAEFVAALRDTATQASDPATPARRAPAATSRRRIAGMALGACMAAGLGAGGTMWATRREPPASVVRFSFPAPVSSLCFAISSDGKRFVFSGPSVSAPLQSRTIDDETVRPIAGTDGATSCFLSPDGEWIGFWQARGLMKVPVAGGQAVKILSTPSIRGASWGPDGTILFGGAGGGLFTVSAEGGSATLVVSPDSTAGEAVYTSPHFLPDGKTFVATLRQRGERSLLVVGGLDGKVNKSTIAGTSPRYVPDNRILFTIVQGATYLVDIDVERRALVGAPVEILSQTDAVLAQRASVDVSRSGTLVYMRGRPPSDLVFVGSGGSIQKLPLEQRRVMRHPRLSPDGTRIVVEVEDSDASRDLWVYGVGSGTFTRLTFDGASVDPVWTPDSKRIAFARRSLIVDGRRESFAGALDVFWVAADGTGEPEKLLGDSGNQWPMGFSPDGGTVYFDELPANGSPMRIAAASVGGTDRRIIVGSAFPARLGAPSPDGQWLAYASSETGRNEVFVRSINEGGGKLPVSNDGGYAPFWSRDGKTLYYRAGGRVMAVRVSTTPTLTLGTPQPFAEDVFIYDNGGNLDATNDGRILALRPTESINAIHVVVNWRAEFDRRSRQD